MAHHMHSEEVLLFFQVSNSLKLEQTAHLFPVITINYVKSRNLSSMKLHKGSVDTILKRVNVYYAVLLRNYLNLSV